MTYHRLPSGVFTLNDIQCLNCPGSHFSLVCGLFVVTWYFVLIQIDSCPWVCKDYQHQFLCFSKTRDIFISQQGFSSSSRGPMSSLFVGLRLKICPKSDHDGDICSLQVESESTCPHYQLSKFFSPESFIPCLPVQPRSQMDTRFWDII